LSFAYFSEDIITQLAPSFNLLALAAVIVPSFKNAGFNLPNFSGKNF